MSGPPRRILQINKFHWLKGGSERYYFDLQAGLTARGHQVAVFSTANSRNEPTPYDRFFVPEVDYSGSSALAAPNLVRNIIWNKDAATRLDRLIEEFRPDVAHLHNFHHQLSPSILAPLERHRVPAVQTLHDYKWVCPAYLFLSHGEVCERCGPGNRFQPVVLRQCHHDSFFRSLAVYFESSRSWGRKDYERVARFLAPSRFLAERVTAHGLPAERVITVPYFLPLENYQPRAEAGSGFLYLGRLSHEKGLEVLFDALALTKERTSLRVAGAGPLEASLRERAARENLPVIFLGHLDAKTLHDTIRSAKAVIVPSRWYENQPYAILESMALGVPVIGSAIGGIPELIEDGQTGRIVLPGDAQALSDAMAFFLETPGASLEMGQAARRFIEGNFGATAALARLEGLYSDVIEGRIARRQSQ